MTKRSRRRKAGYWGTNDGNSKTIYSYDGSRDSGGPDIHISRVPVADIGDGTYDGHLVSIQPGGVRCRIYRGDISHWSDYLWGSSLVGTEKEVSQLSEAIAPLPAIIHCPFCHFQHIDEGKWREFPHSNHKCDNCEQMFRIEPYCYGVETEEIVPCNECFYDFHTDLLVDITGKGFRVCQSCKTEIEDGIR